MENNFDCSLYKQYSVYDDVLYAGYIILSHEILFFFLIKNAALLLDKYLLTKGVL